VGQADHAWRRIPFGRAVEREFPVVVGDIGSTNGRDPCVLRYRALAPDAIELVVQEEQSRDRETWHAVEDIPLFVAE
jgi:hypothetical protein